MHADQGKNRVRVAVVGATGVLGRSLIPLLLDRGYAVRAIVRSAVKARDSLPAGIEIAAGDLLDPQIDRQLPDLIAGCEAIAHIATAIPRDMSAPRAWEANTQLRTGGARSLLQAALKVGAKHYLQQSITMAYPDCGEEWITEDRPLDASPKRATICAPVIAMEHSVRSLADDRLRWCILRGGSFVGPDTFQDKVLDDLRNGRLILAGTGLNFVSLIHVTDMAAALVNALEVASDRAIFNIVDEPLREGEYLDRLADSIGVARPTRDTTRPAPPSWRCSNHAARSILRWSPAHSIIPLASAQR